MSNLAPIILFVYNRPEHTRNTLEALSKNELANQSLLYIYCDGPKANVSREELSNIQQVRQIVKHTKWCKQVEVVTKKENHGLADSIISGISEVMSKHDSTIILEDDIVTSKGFLMYMNEALKYYKEEKRVMHIAGFLHPIDNSRLAAQTCFLKLGTCWGWATWADRWSHFEPSASILYHEIRKLQKDKLDHFNHGNNSLRMLKKCMNQEIDSWAIRWYASIFLKDGLSLHPKRSLVQNIGFDGSGSHSYKKNLNNMAITDNINIQKIKIELTDEVDTRLRKFFIKSKLLSAPTFYLNKLIKSVKK